MTDVTCRLTAKNRDQLRNPTLGNRVWASFLYNPWWPTSANLRNVVCCGCGVGGVGLGPDLQNILRQSYDYLTIMPKLRSTCDGRLIYEKHPTKGARLSLGTIHLQSCKIVRDSVRKLAYDISERNFSTF